MRRAALRRHIVCFALALAASTAKRQAAANDEQVSPESDLAARAEFEAGRDAYEHAEFGAALVHFDRAYELSRRSKLLFNIARAADADGQRIRAIAAYREYLERMPEADNREFAAARLRWLEQQNARETAKNSTAPEVVASEQEPVLRPWQRLRFYVGPYLGIGGKWKQRYDELPPRAVEDAELVSALHPSFGVQLGSELALNRWLGIGGELRYSSYMGDGWVSDRDVLLDILARPSARYRFSRENIEVFAALPIGLTVPRLAAPTEGSWSARPGLNVAVSAGVLYPLARYVALALEAGYSWHAFHAYLLDDYEPEVTFRVGQGFLALNAVVPLSAFGR